jgi:hypothetical protein
LAQQVLAAHTNGAAEFYAYSAMVSEAPAGCRELDVTLRPSGRDGTIDTPN